MNNPRHLRQHRGQEGFTLLELLIAMTLTAVVFALLGSSLHLFAQGWDKRMSEASQRDMVSRAFSLVARDIEGTQRIVHEGEDEPQFIFQGQKDGLSLVAMEPPYPTRSGLFLITYGVKRAKGGAMLLRQRQAFHPDVEIKSRMDTRNAVPVIDGPYAMTFSYLDKDAGWRTSWTDKTRLPTAISLQVQNRGSTRLAFAPLIARLRLDAEIGCIEEEPEQCSALDDGVLQAATKQDTEGGEKKEPKERKGRDE